MANGKTDLQRAWGQAVALLVRTRKTGWADLVVLAGLGAIVFALVSLGRQWTAELRPAVEIDLSPWALPLYTFYSVSRGLLAYCCSLAFTLVYGYWAAKDPVAERVLVPALDILQSIPVLGFMPGLVLALIALFPSSNIGLELVAIIMIFTGQAWNMTFSFYHSIRTVPLDQREVATIYGFNWWQRFKWVELPFSMMGLVWNSMMSMAGGWFFLMVCEAFRLGERDFRLPGLGAYMSVAVEQGRLGAMLWAIAAMVLAIVALDQFLWRPVVVWAQKFRVEEGGSQEAMSSWFLSWLRHSRILASLARLVKRVRRQRPATPAVEPGTRRTGTAGLPRWFHVVSAVAFAALLELLAYGVWRLVILLEGVGSARWGDILLSAGFTLGRVLLAVGLGTLWTLPAGLAIGLSPRLSRIFQPIVQVAASFPAPMLFPLVIALLSMVRVSLDWGSIALMLLGTQWYILFNVIAGAMAIPADLREAAVSYRIVGWRRFRILYFPAVFPYLVTGWVTVTGGAWNASIVAEYVTFRGEVLKARGLGERISEAAERADFAMLAASILVMALIVVVFNRSVWRRLYNLAEERFSLNK